MIEFQCKCGRELFADSDKAGQMLACPGCNATMTIPSTADNIKPQTLAPAPPHADDHVERRRPQRRRRRPAYRDDYDEPRYSARQRLQGTSGKAVAAFLMGVLAIGGAAALVVFRQQISRINYLFLIISGLLFVFSLIALIVGISSLSDIRRGRTGMFVAITAMITGGMSLLFIPVFSLIFGLVFAVEAVRETAKRMESTNDMRRIALGIHIYHDANRFIPQHAIYHQNKPMLSWRVAILPYVEQDNLFRQFRKNEPWDSPHNLQLLKNMPRLYAHPNHPKEAADGLTYYQVFVMKKDEGRPGPLFRQRSDWRARLLVIPDGMANTIMVVEAAEPVPWTKPADLVYDPNGPLPKIGGHFRNNQVNIGLADGEVVSIPDDIADDVLRPAITMDGGEAFHPPWD